MRGYEILLILLNKYDNNFDMYNYIFIYVVCIFMVFYMYFLFIFICLIIMFVKIVLINEIIYN